MKLAAFQLSHGNVIGRAALLVPVVLALWWFVLKGASFWALRVLSWLPLALFVAPPGAEVIRVEKGDWLCNVAVNAEVQNPQTRRPEHVDSIEVAIHPDDAANYASGWFSYLALALAAAPAFWKQAKRVAAGLAIQTVLSTLGFAAYVYIAGFGTLINSSGNPDQRIWWIKYFDYINTLVVPFAGPFLIAILVYPEWRASVGFVRPAKTVSSNVVKRRGR